MLTAKWFWGDPVSMFDELRKAQNQFRPVDRTERRAGVYPAVNIYDDGESFLVRAEVSGIDKAKLDITSKGNQLSIRGERVNKPVADDAAFHRREREQGVFHRVVTLPEHVNPAKIMATYKSGVLEIICPRAESAKSHKIQIG